jgi:hypothetical protein
MRQRDMPPPRVIQCAIVLLLLVWPGGPRGGVVSAEPQSPAGTIESCFLLFELGVGEIRRRPSEACRTRLTPASTFKVPHALAALDAG